MIEFINFTDRLIDTLLKTKGVKFLSKKLSFVLKGFFFFFLANQKKFKS